MNKLLLPIVFSIIIISGTTQAALAGVAGSPPFEENFVHAEWDNPPEDRTPPTVFNFDTNSPFELFPLQFLGVDPNGEGRCFEFLEPPKSRCEFLLPNYIDDLDTKIIMMVIEFTGPEPDDLSIIQCVEVPDAEEGPPFNQISHEGVILSKDSEPNRVTLLIECHPNPQFDRMGFIKSLETTITHVEMWTVSFDEQPVGGEFLPIDNTALLLAGLQTSAIWMLPVLAGAAGIGAYYIKTRMNKE